VGGGVGAGFTQGFGSPELRALASVEWAPAMPTPPADRDHDSILDRVDACPDEPGIASADPGKNGCPLRDRDGDQILDSDDRCPDSDGDGVLDRNDQCPNVAGVAPLGCPGDSDGDGIADPDDKCPSDPETKNGFEDTDGCPDVLPDAVKKFTGAIAGIEFDVGKGTIRKGSSDVLDQAAKILADYPDLKVEIAGHTDDTGAHDYNVKLSQERADAVKSYLASKGVGAERITTRGAGPDEPLGNEKTNSARQKNRRIEFHIQQ